MGSELLHIIIEEFAKRELGTLKLPMIQISCSIENKEGKIYKPFIKYVHTSEKEKLLKFLADELSYSRERKVELNYLLKTQTSLYLAVNRIIENHNYFVEKIDYFKHKIQIK
jgi:hypothetical protein